MFSKSIILIITKLLKKTQAFLSFADEKMNTPISFLPNKERFFYLCIKEATEHNLCYFSQLIADMAVLKEVLVLVVCLLIVRSKAQFTFDYYSTSGEGGSSPPPPSTLPPPQPTTGVPSTVGPTVAPTVGPTLAPPSSSPGPNIGLDRECGCNHSRIWLDIVAVIDTSLSITQEGLSQVQANLDTIVHELTLSTTPGYSSRISIVTFASNATTVAGLNVFSSTDDFENAIFGVALSVGDNKVNILR